MIRLPLLPLLFLLSPGFGKASAQETRPNNMVTVSEGDNALLPCDLSSENSVRRATFDWRKDNGEHEVFMYDNGKYSGSDLKGQSEQFAGRVEFFKDELKSGNASIKILDTRLEDNGTYTCFVMNPVTSVVNIILNVGAAPVPYIDTIEDEGTWRLLECTTKGVPEPEVEWRNSAGEVLAKHAPKSQSGPSDVKLQLKVTKSDTYTCLVNQKSIYHQTNKTIKVALPGAAPEPYIDTIEDEGTWRLLECKTKGVPEPEVEWRNSAGEVLAKHAPKSQSGPSDVKLQLKVTKSDTYTCLVNQKSIYHQTNKTIKVALPALSTLLIGIIATIVVIAVFLCCGFCVLVVQKLRRRTGRSSRHVTRQPANL